MKKAGEIPAPSTGGGRFAAASKGRGETPLHFGEKQELNPNDTDPCTAAVRRNWNFNLCLSLPKKEIWAVMRVCKGKPSNSPSEPLS